jgi:hypothetical protein
MPTYNRLTDRTIVSGLNLNDIFHIVVTGDTTQSPQGSSYFAPISYLTPFFSGGSDTYITGGTYSNGDLTLTNNSGVTINISGFYTGGTDIYVTGGTYNDITGIATFTNNTGGTFNVSGFFTGSTGPVVTGSTSEVLTSDGSGGINSQPNLTFDGTHLNVSGSSSFIHNPVVLLTTSVSGYGDIVTFGSGSTSVGDLHYYSGGSWSIANSTTTSGSTGMLGFALGLTPSDGMLIKGYLRNSGFTTSDGDILFVSTTNGEISTTQPIGAGNVVRIIGYSIDGTNGVIYFNPDNTWIEI